MLQSTLFASIVMFLLGVLCAVYIAKSRKADPKQVIGCLIGGTATALLPLYLNGHSDAKGGPIDMVFTSILGVVRAMTGENSVFDTREMLGTVPRGAQAAVAIYTAVLHLVATALLLGFLLSLFQDFFPKISYRFYRSGRLYVFTELSERTLLLAEDLYKNPEPPGVVFVFLGKAIEEDATNYCQRLQEVGGFLFDLDVCDLKLHRRLQKQPIEFFLLKSNETENLRDALELVARYGESDMASVLRIHILSSQPEAQTVVDSIEYTSKISLRLVRETRAMIYHLFDVRPLFLGARGDKLDILVVGAGRSGMEAIKTACWCGQTIRLRPNILVVDKDPTVESRFEGDCPELSSRTAPIESLQNCRVQFFTADVESGQFTDLIKAHPSIGYVVCALGDESLNLRTAMTIRGVFEGLRFLPEHSAFLTPPIINVLLGDAFLSDVSGRLKFDTRADCKLSPFGSLKETYTWDNIVAPYLDFAGISVNRFYARQFCGEGMEALSLQQRVSKIVEIEKQADIQYESKEYNRAASIALGLHCKYKAYACLCEAAELSFTDQTWSGHPDKQMIHDVQNWLFDESVGAQRVEVLAQVEHRRWNTFMRAQGWCGASFAQADGWYDQLGGHRNFAAKLHPCLVSWEELPAVDGWLQEHHHTKSDFRELDRIMVRALPEILSQANDLFVAEEEA